MFIGMFINMGMDAFTDNLYPKLYMNTGFKYCVITLTCKMSLLTYREVVANFVKASQMTIYDMFLENISRRPLHTQK